MMCSGLAAADDSTSEAECVEEDLGGGGATPRSWAEQVEILDPED